MLGTQNVLDRAEHIGLAVTRADDSVLLHIRADNVGGGAMRVDMVRPVLGVVFNDDDQSVAGIGAVGNGLNQQAHGIVVIGLLQFRSIDAA